MKLTFQPVRMDEDLLIDREGDVLHLNGMRADFSQLEEGAELPVEAIDSPWFAGPVSRVDGELELVLLLPHGAQAPVERRFPHELLLDDDGPVSLPPYDCPPSSPRLVLSGSVSGEGVSS